MSTINVSADQSTFTMKEFLGLHECPDGDTKLKFGESPVMRNFKITRDKNLRTRPGNMTIMGLCQNYEWYADAIADALVTESGLGRMKCFSDVDVDYKEQFTLSGTEVDVSHENWNDYVGYYFKYGHFYYRLDRVLTLDTGYQWLGFKLYPKAITSYGNLEVQGIWSGEINQKLEIIAACNGKMWKLWDDDNQAYIKTELGSLDTTGRVSFLDFGGKVYVLNGHEYYVYDGHCLQLVTGYRPLTYINFGTSEQAALEEINKLNGLRRIWISPDGTKTQFYLPEADISSVDWVSYTKYDSYTSDGIIDPSTYTVDLINGTVTFNTAPEAGTNTIEIAYTYPTNYRTQVTGMRYFETFAGTGEARVMIYGDGSNEIFYSSVDYDGQRRADYFPDLNEIQVGSQNTKVTGLVRHFSALIAFKENETYSITYGTTTLADGNLQDAFYLTPVNKAIGNEAMGMVPLILNAPRSLYHNEIYEWKSNTSRTGNLTNDERQAKRISDRIYDTLRSFDFTETYCFDDNYNQEYYVCYDDDVLVHNYAVDAWYYYNGLNIHCMAVANKTVLIGTKDGDLMVMSEKYKTNNGYDIDFYWESGSMDFGRAYQRKSSTEMWTVLKPESAGAICVTVETDRRSIYNDKTVTSSIFDFGDTDFSMLTFNTNQKPHSKRLKIKAKKFVFYKVIYKSARPGTVATVLSTNIQVRFTGKAK